MEIIDSTDKKLVEKVCQTLENGNLVIFPTETCYGVAADATNPSAVERLIKYKKRPEGKAISVAVSNEKMASDYVEINETAKNIYTEFLPGPVTVISKSLGKVDPRLESEKKTLGIRIPDYDLVLEIIKAFGKPITSTSANPASKKNPYSLQDFLDVTSEQQREQISIFIDAGELPKNLTSSVIDTTTETLKTYRIGNLNFDDKSKLNKKVTHSVEETIEFGESFIKLIVTEGEDGHPRFQNSLIKREHATYPIVILLHGDLGAGKTHFTKGIAKGLGIDRIIKSPTYNYYDEYKFSSRGHVTSPSNQNKLFHIDAWRIENKDDLESLNIKGMMSTGNILVVEWPEIILNLGGENYFENCEVHQFWFENTGENERLIYYK